MIWVQFLHNIAFFVAIFLLRDIEDQFNIIDELRKVCIVTTLCTAAYITFIVYFDTSVFVVLGWCQYLLLIDSLAILYLTALDPIARSFKQSHILPFSLNSECLLTMETAIIQTIPANSFYSYLHLDLRDEMGLTLFAMYADLRTFMSLCDKPVTVQSQFEIQTLAVHIFNEYIVEEADVDFGEEPVFEQLRNVYIKKCDKICTNINETLFNNLILFTTGALEVYYEKF